MAGIDSIRGETRAIGPADNLGDPSEQVIPPRGGDTFVLVSRSPAPWAPVQAGFALPLTLLLLLGGGLILRATPFGSRLAGRLRTLRGVETEVDQLLGYTQPIFSDGIGRLLERVNHWGQRRVRRMSQEFGLGFDVTVRRLLYRGERLETAPRTSPAVHEAMKKLIHHSGGWASDSRGIAFGIDCNRFQRTEPVVREAKRLMRDPHGRLRVVYFVLIDEGEYYCRPAGQKAWILSRAGLLDVVGLFRSIERMPNVTAAEKSRCAQIYSDIHWLATRIS
ncbi:MAG: hypothetical protein HYT76_09650 [Deltaproteobacteria bacterium]|nr:hypothetical protein [Deltaproteobacteria bacterium]